MSRRDEGGQNGGHFSIKQFGRHKTEAALARAILSLYTLCDRRGDVERPVPPWPRQSRMPLESGRCADWHDFSGRWRAKDVMSLFSLLSLSIAVWSHFLTLIAKLTKVSFSKTEVPTLSRVPHHEVHHR
jgi:hypothetical protein